MGGEAQDEGMAAWTAAMRRGDHATAWALGEETLRARDPATRDDPALPYYLRWVWDGRPFDGRNVLVRCYHGLGDTLQFARFLPLLAARAASVTVEAPERLLSLLTTINASLRLEAFDVSHPLPPSECDMEITELDLALRVAPGGVPVPYLQASHAVLPAGTIAICHSAGDWDAARNVPPELFAPLARQRPCVTLNPGRTTLPVLNPEGCPFDMTATAALVAGADLVITVDTMIAHLAGALGRPTWLLLKAEPDWRWAPDRRTSAWYPSIRQYVQPAPGDWTPVLAEAAADLARLSAPSARKGTS